MSPSPAPRTGCKRHSALARKLGPSAFAGSADRNEGKVPAGGQGTDGGERHRPTRPRRRGPSVVAESLHEHLAGRAEGHAALGGTCAERVVPAGQVAQAAPEIAAVRHRAAIAAAARESGPKAVREPGLAAKGTHVERLCRRSAPNAESGYAPGLCRRGGSAGYGTVRSHPGLHLYNPEPPVKPAGLSFRNGPSDLSEFK